MAKRAATTRVAKTAAARAAVPADAASEFIIWSGIGDIYNVFASDPAVPGQVRFVRQIRRKDIPPRLLAEVNRFSNAMRRHWG